jgi:hypothetical protein
VLSVNGQKYQQKLTVTIDPRVKATQADLEDQLAWAQKATRGLAETTGVYYQLTALLDAIADRQKSAASDADLNSALKLAAEKILEVREGARPPADAPPGTLPILGVGPINRELARTFAMIESGDMRPPETAKSSVQELCAALDKDLNTWRLWDKQTLPGLNAQLASHQLAQLPMAMNLPAVGACGQFGPIHTITVK